MRIQMEIDDNGNVLQLWSVDTAGRTQLVPPADVHRRNTDQTKSPKKTVINTIEVVAGSHICYQNGPNRWCPPHP